mmetsp:Transcript_22823/g.74536  ORF Transcript_22823/g.74536 Transcript_22823/m.74536 type:complete len:381 (+) Transcript_22823:507-1649(+)
MSAPWPRASKRRVKGPRGKVRGVRVAPVSGVVRSERSGGPRLQPARGVVSRLPPFSLHGYHLCPFTALASTVTRGSAGPWRGCAHRALLQPLRLASLVARGEQKGLFSLGRVEPRLERPRLLLGKVEPRVRLEQRVVLARHLGARALRDRLRHARLLLGTVQRRAQPGQRLLVADRPLAQPHHLDRRVVRHGAELALAGARLARLLMRHPQLRAPRRLLLRPRLRLGLQLLAPLARRARLRPRAGQLLALCVERLAQSRLSLRRALHRGPVRGAAAAERASVPLSAAVRGEGAALLQLRARRGVAQGLHRAERLRGAPLLPPSPAASRRARHLPRLHQPRLRRASARGRRRGDQRLLARTAAGAPHAARRGRAPRRAAAD